MPSKSLVSSWTTSFVPSGTRPSHSPRKAYPGRLSPPRLRVLKHLHGLWKGTPSPRNVQLASGPIRRAPSTISTPRVTLASRLSPTPSPLIFCTPSPTSPTLTSLPSGIDADFNTVKFSRVEPGSMPFRHFKSLSPLVPRPDAELPREPSCSSRQPVSSLHPHSPALPCMSSSTSLVAACGSGSTLDAATRLQDFRALIEEMRTTLLHHDSKEEFDVRNCGDGDDDEEERERLLWLLEDVMRKVKQLAEKDAVGLGRSVTIIDAVP